MDVDEEDAPALVDVNEVKEIIRNDEATNTVSRLRDLSLAKVPLTIVTGESSKSCRKPQADLSLISNFKAILAQGRLRWSITS